MNKADVLLYVPNIIGYLRIFLTLAAFLSYHHPFWFIVLYASSTILDGVDGFAARKLNQCSAFGAWFDVVVDLFSRGLLWCSLYQYGYLVIFVEWLTFVCTHYRGPQWKMTEDDFPWLVTKVMANGFKTSWGVVAIAGLHVLPLWLYAYQSAFLTSVGMATGLQLLGIALLTVGRVVCLCVEDQLANSELMSRKGVETPRIPARCEAVFFAYNHVVFLLNCDTSSGEN